METVINIKIKIIIMMAISLVKYEYIRFILTVFLSRLKPQTLLHRIVFEVVTLKKLPISVAAQTPDILYQQMLDTAIYSKVGEMSSINLFNLSSSKVVY